MMKARGFFAGREVVILALSHANLDRLRADGLKGSIRIDGKEVGLPLDIHITAGETEAEIFKAFADSIGPETVLHIDKRLKS